MFPNLDRKVIGFAVVSGMLAPILYDWSSTNAYVEVVHAQEVVEEPREVLVEVVIDWSRERIVQEIHNTFPENPDLAVRIAQCESGLKMIQSNHVLSYGREQSWGIFQIHAKDWENKAIQLGYPDYKTDIQQNIQMARYIYDNSGWRAWSCFTKKMI